MRDENVFETGPEEIHDHNIGAKSDANPSHGRYSNSSSENVVNLGLILDRRESCLDGFDLDGDLLSRLNIDPKVDSAK